MNDHTKKKEMTNEMNLHIISLHDDMRREVKERPEDIRNMYIGVRDILDYDFEAIYSYFLEILEKGYDYTILMSRRCLVLYQVYMYFFILEEKKIPKKTLVISDKAIPYYSRNFKETDKIAIVDDVIVHGRAVSSTYDIIKEVCPDVEIDIYGYTSEENINCLSDEVKERTYVEYPASTREWRNLSNKIVDCISIANVPYTSFVTSYYQYDSKIKNLFEALDKNFISYKDLTKIKSQEYFEYQNIVCSDYLFECNWDKPAIFSSLSLCECIRIYSNDCTNKLTVIPYVFIRSLSDENTEMIIDKIGDLLPEKCSNIKEIFKLKEKDSKLGKALKEYKMRVLTCLLSDYYWKSFLDRYQIPNPQYTDMDTLVKSFGNLIADEMKKLEIEDMKEIVNYSFDISGNIYNVRKENFYKRSKNSNKSQLNSIKLWLSDKFYDAWSEDERRARDNEARAQGFSIDSLLKQGMELGYNMYLLLYRLVSNWDTGVAAANFSYNSNNNIMACYVNSGEQSYKIVLENNANIMNALIRVSNMVTKDAAAKKGKEFKKYRVELLKQLLDKYKENESLRKQDYNNICEIIELEDGYLNAWDQPIVWESEMLDKNKEIMTEFINENF